MKILIRMMSYKWKYEFMNMLLVAPISKLGRYGSYGLRTANSASPAVLNNMNFQQYQYLLRYKMKMHISPPTGLGTESA